MDYSLSHTKEMEACGILCLHIYIIFNLPILLPLFASTFMYEKSFENQGKLIISYKEIKEKIHQLINNYL